MLTYQIIIRIPFQAIDDPDARTKLMQLNLSPLGEIKLQEIKPNQPPRGIQI